MTEAPANYLLPGVVPSASRGGNFLKLVGATTTALLTMPTWSETKTEEPLGALAPRRSLPFLPLKAESSELGQALPMALFPVGFAHRTELDQLVRRLDSLAKLPSNWNSYGAEAPNETALIGARNVLERAHAGGILPSRISPSADDGVVLCFERGDRYSDIECFNNGEILGVIHDRSPMRATAQPDVWAIQEDAEITAALELIRGFINV